MALETILQNEVATKFIYPFVLIFVFIYAILEKTKILGDGKHQVNAIISLVIGLIFVSVAYPKLIVGNMVLFLTVALVVVFVVLIIWGFIMGGDSLKIMEKASTPLKWVIGIVIILAVIIATLWATGIDTGVFEFLFKQSWSNELWTNIAFIAAIVIADRKSVV